MSFDFGAIKTKNGYRMDEVASSMQKELRRSDKMLALFWAQELMETGYGRYMWKRMVTVAVEDLGTAEAATTIESLATSWERLSGEKISKGPWDYLTVAQAVRYLCDSPKSRETTFFTLNVETLRKQGWRPEVKDWARDMHTFAGKNRLRAARKKDPLAFIREWMDRGQFVGPRAIEGCPMLEDWLAIQVLAWCRSEYQKEGKELDPVVVRKFLLEQFDKHALIYSNRGSEMQEPYPGGDLVDIAWQPTHVAARWADRRRAFDTRVAEALVSGHDPGSPILDPRPVAPAGDAEIETDVDGQISIWPKD